MLIRKSAGADFAGIWAIINDAAHAYRGVIPADRWHEPYMRASELLKEIASGVVFWVAEDDGSLLGVMGIQDKGDVALVRHAYVAPAMYSSGTSFAAYASPMGLRVRLRADYDLSHFSGASLVVLHALRRYGMMLVDNTALPTSGGWTLGDKLRLAHDLITDWSEHFRFSSSPHPFARRRSS